MVKFVAYEKLLAQGFAANGVGGLGWFEALYKMHPAIDVAFVEFAV